MFMLVIQSCESEMTTSTLIDKETHKLFQGSAFPDMMTSDREGNGISDRNNL